MGAVTDAEATAQVREDLEQVRRQVDEWRADVSTQMLDQLRWTGTVVLIVWGAALIALVAAFR